MDFILSTNSKLGFLNISEYLARYGIQIRKTHRLLKGTIQQWGEFVFCKSNNYWRNGNVAVPGLIIYSGGKRGWNYLEWRKAGGELFRVTVTGKNIYIYTHTHIYIYLYIYLYIYIFF